MIEYVHRHRVRYREVDPMGLVYHTHYVDYFEAARTELLRELGVAYKEVEDTGIIMPVVDLHVKFHRPAFYDDVLAITARVEEIPEMRANIDYEVRRDGEALVLTTGRVTLCFVDRERNRPVHAPDSFRRLFQQALESTDASSETS